MALLHKQRWERLGALFLGLSLLGCTALASAPADTDVLRPYDYYYGVYVSGQKVGWMRCQLDVGDTWRFSTVLRAQVAGMGKVSDIELNEARSYDAKTGKLENLEFVQSASTGEVRVSGHREGQHFALGITAGGATKTEQIDIAERLTDAVALFKLAHNPKVGAHAQSVHFDPSIQKSARVEHTVQAIEKRMLGGVEARAVKVISKYPDLGVSETAWIDSTGKMLESQIGGFFVARLEPPELAKQLDVHQDLLVSAVVRAPRVIVEPQTLQQLRLTFHGFGEMVPPASARQVVRAEDGAVLLTLRKDPMPTRTPLAKAGEGASPADAAGVKEALQPTPFIQSDAPEIIEAAKGAVGAAQDVFTASTRLSEFVYRHIHSEYVPAYSNALEAFKTARGDCTEHSILFVAMARAVGIPARVVVGIAYWPPGDGFGWHAWAEIYAGGRWIAVDPTWNQSIADATHVKLADGGPAEQARIVMLLGQLKITDMKTSL
jgi:hypothetical protein